MRDILLLAVLFGAVPVILMRPYIGVLVWSWISYMNPHRLAYGMAYDFPVAALTGGTLLVSLLFSKEPKRIPWTRVTITWVAFVLWMCVTTMFALVPDDAIAAWDRMIKIQLITFVTLMLVRTKERIFWLVLVIAASIGFYGVKGGLFTVLTAGDYTVWGPPDSFIAGNNEVALALVMIIPLMYYLREVSTKKWARLALWGAIALCAFAVLGSYSRGAFLAASAMALFLMLKRRKNLFFAVFLLVTIPLLLNFMPEQWHERMDTIGSYQEDPSAMGRINAWWFAFNLAKDRPLVGGGFNTFDPELFRRYAPESENFHDAHSIYFQVLGEHGFIGLILFLTLGILAFRTGAWTIRHTKDRPTMKWMHDLASMIQVSLIGYAVGGTFLGLAYFDLFYHLVAILVLIRQAAESELAQANGEISTRETPVPEAAPTLAMEQVGTAGEKTDS